MRKITFDEFCKSIGTTEQSSMDLLIKYHDPNYYNPKDLDGIIHHHLIFCAIASSNIHIKSMFEIGTCAGNCARVLSNIFPEALIKTLDIPENKDRKNAVRLLTPLKNIKMLEYNSAFLWNNEKELHDCIFVDGCHKHPIVFSDMLWAYFNAKKIVLFHDVGPGEPNVVESLKYLNFMINEETLIVKSGVDSKIMSDTGVLIKR